jgi:hypothetical protein
VQKIHCSLMLVYTQQILCWIDHENSVGPSP